MRQIRVTPPGSLEKYGRMSKRGRYLETMERIVPWGELQALIEPHCPRAGRGRQPVGLSMMLRVYFLQP
jgi:IS5 family transposase